MTDTATGSKTEKTAKKKGAGQGWNASADGQSVSRTFTLGSASEAAKLAKRALQLAEKTGQAVDLRLAATSVTIGLAATGGFVSDAERKMIKRLEGKRSDEAKAAKAERRSHKPDTDAAPAAAKPAKAKPAKATKPAAAKSTAAKSTRKPATKA
jgi:pterin-4a-carbinolamine dehydratase